MEIIWPDYYSDFHCIADKCKHTCCAGWEIDVDEVSLDRFLGFQDIIKHIDNGSIVLGDKERCPFLRQDGLCKMILDYGEDFLCDICKEHPRYYVDCIDHYEGGIGLVCEEACRLILDYVKDFKLTDGTPLPEEISLAFDITKPLSQTLEYFSENYMDSKTRAKIFLELEVLDETWPRLLNKILDSAPSKALENTVIDSNRRQFSNFLAYLLYRHRDATNFAVESTRLLADLVILGVDIHEAARMFSGEIEYSDENIERLYDL